MITETEKKAYWNNKMRSDLKCDDLHSFYGGWLEQNGAIINKGGKVLELGCGTGIDTLHLTECGYNVIACDFAENAINEIHKNIPQAKTLQFNMEIEFPFETPEFKMVVANKSLHYFSEKCTFELFNKIYNCLLQNGIFAFVVSSVKDYSGKGVEIEKNFYEIRTQRDGTPYKNGATTRRCFDKEILEKLISANNWEILACKEEKFEGSSLKGIDPNYDKKWIWVVVLKKL